MRTKKPAYRGGIKTRRSTPGVMNTKDGAQLSCPFCNPTHVLVPGTPGHCGTILEITAVQQVISSRIVRNEGLVCARCRQGDGEMVKYMNGYIHLANCAPGTRLLSELPEFSKSAEFVFRLPGKVRSFVERITGVVQYVKEIDTQGQETGRIVGYFFLKGKSNGRTRQAKQSTTG